MKYTIFDIEADGLLDELTKIHCLSFIIVETGKKAIRGTITDYSQIPKFLNNQEILIGHFIVNYDLPAIEKILKVKLEGRFICTLSLSYYLFPIKGFLHGLEHWGERFGIKKPEIGDWKNLTLEEYIFRCEQDVEINLKTFEYQIAYLKKLYNTTDSINSLMNYTTYKMDCIKEQEEQRLNIDERLCLESLHNLEFMFSEKEDILSDIMPQIVDKTCPKIMYKQDGELSAHGKRWMEVLEEKGLPSESKVTYKKGNPGSPDQLKDWLFSLGWIPETFKVSKNTGKDLPQVNLPHGQGLCPSVKKLYSVEPQLEHLEGIYKIRHRKGLVKGFIECMDENKTVQASMSGFTNTLRIQHKKPIANLPGVSKFYGKEIRGCITVPNDDYIMFGADISGLEDNTKQHYMYYYDPEYVNQMRVEGFDPHLDIGVFAGIITEDDSNRYKFLSVKKDSGETLTDEEKAFYSSVKEKRSDAKVINFSGVYGAGPAKIADSLGCTLAFAKNLHKAYWERNWAVKEIAKNCKIKKVGKYRWLYNPVSTFWLFLKEDKDRFSTLNQSTGVYVFDTWVRNVRNRINPLGLKLGLQYHDEILGICKREHKEAVDIHLREAMREANEQLKLNVLINISVDWGVNYAECH